MKKYIIPIFFLGTLWGANEVLLGNYLYENNHILLAHKSVILNLMAFSLLLIGRLFIPYKGIGILMGLIAILFKIAEHSIINTPLCHILGIFSIALIFECIWSLYFDKKKESLLNLVKASLIIPILSYVFFTFTITYVFQYKFWTKLDINELIRFIILEGSFTTILCVIVSVSLYKIKNSLSNIKINISLYGFNLILLIISLILWILKLDII